MKGPSCTYSPDAWDVEGKVSKLYSDLMDKVGGDRPFTNYIYTLYRQDGVADTMDAQGYKRDRNGEHKVNDVYKFFNVANMRTEAGVSTDSLARTIGVMDSSGRYIDFDAKIAYQKALDFNNNSQGGKVAYVQQHGDKFNVVLDNVDSKTFLYKADVELQMKEWQAVDTAFGSHGISLDALATKYPEIFNPTRVYDFLHYIKSLADTSSPRYLNKRDINIVLGIAARSPKIQNLLSRGWGTAEETAEKAFDVLHNPSAYAPDLVTFVTEALKEGMTLNDAFVEDLKTDLKDNVDLAFTMTSKEYDMKETLKELNDKYGIDTNVMILHDREIRRLSQAAGHAIITLQRQIDKLKSEGRGTNAQLQEISDTINAISKEIDGKRYYAGLLTFMSKALQYAQRIQKELTNIPTTGTKAEYISARADILTTAKNFQDSYRFIVESLATIDNLIIDENITDADRAILKQQAEEVLKILNAQEKVMSNLREDTMIDICTEVVGSNIIDGKAVADIVRMSESDMSIMDFLYSVGRQSNFLISAMGTVIRDAQIERDQIVNGYRLAISRATDALYKSGSNSEFMYVKNDKGFYRIASDIDFDAFARDKAKYRGRMKMRGLRGFQLKDAMDAWMEANTEIDGRYSQVSRVPKRSIYGTISDFQDGWTDAQKQYYDTVMKLKGQIEELLPSYAQNLYLPPQRRASWLDIIKKGIDGKMTTKQVVKNLLDRMNPIKVRANEQDYGMFIDNNNYIETKGDFDSNILRTIPIFYTRRLKDQNDLLLDFSAGLLSLAQTAVNYDAMFKIKDIVEMMGDYIKSRNPVAKRNGATQAEVVETQAIHIVSKLRDKNKSFNDLVDGFIDKHIYGVEMKDQGTGWRILQSLINYTSLNQLAPNLKGGLSNFLVGEHQMLIEAVAGSLSGVRLKDKSDVMYTVSDYAAANALVLGTAVHPGNLMDHLSNNTSSTAHLLAERFDPLQDLANEQGGKRYYNSAFRQIVGGFDVMGLYSSGEAIIHYVNMYACLLNEKVLDANGKKVSLYSAFEPYGKRTKKNGNAELTIKQGYKQLDGTAIDDAYLDKVKARIRNINQKTHGSMNREDKGLIHRRMAGRAVMNFRQWMVEHYSRRYRGRYWDYSQRKFVEGYFNTVGKLVQSYASDYVSFINDAHCRWDELDAAQKENVYRACSEVALLAALLGVSALVGDPNKYKGKYWARMWIYQLRRLILDEQASMPWGIPNEGVTVLDSPIASINTINGILYPYTGLINGDFKDTIQSGRYKGWNKYGRNLLKNVPFYKQIDQTLHIADEDYIFSIFNK